MPQKLIRVADHPEPLACTVCGEPTNWYHRGWTNYWRTRCIMHQSAPLSEWEQRRIGLEIELAAERRRYRAFGMTSKEADIHVRHRLLLDAIFSK